MNCEQCKIDIRAETHKPPIWGAQVVWQGHIKSYYFCSERHGNDWIRDHNDYKLVELIVDAK